MNRVTKDLLGDHSGFRMEYPEHVAVSTRLGHLKPTEKEGALTEDYGFLVTGLSRNAPYALMFGVYSAGTWTAVHVFNNLPDLADASLVEQLRARKKLFITARAEVNGFDIPEDKIALVKYWSPPY